MPTRIIPIHCICKFTPCMHDRKRICSGWSWSYTTNSFQGLSLFGGIPVFEQRDSRVQTYIFVFPSLSLRLNPSKIFLSTFTLHFRMQFQFQLQSFLPSYSSFSTASVSSSSKNMFPTPTKNPPFLQLRPRGIVPCTTAYPLHPYTTNLIFMHPHSEWITHNFVSYANPIIRNILASTESRSIFESVPPEHETWSIIQQRRHSTLFEGIMAMSEVLWERRYDTWLRSIGVGQSRLLGGTAW